MEIEYRLKTLEKLLEELQGAVIFVEGKRDREALIGLGVTKTMTISGNLKQSCDSLDKSVDKVYVLTDLDRRGDELAIRAREELESRSIRADIEMRKKLAHMLRIRFFEHAERAYSRIKEEVERGKRPRQKW